MSEIRTVTVFCGSRCGHDPAYAEAAVALARGFAERGITICYGGGKLGLMGVLADAALAVGGSVCGVIPDFLVSWEVAHAGLSELTVVNSMHARKATLFERADAFVVLPGGLGTLDELVEATTWKALGQHSKPILICNIDGSAFPFAAAIDGAIERGFASSKLRALFEVVNGARAVLARIDELPAAISTGIGPL